MASDAPKDAKVQVSKEVADKAPENVTTVEDDEEGDEDDDAEEVEDGQTPGGDANTAVKKKKKKPKKKKKKAAEDAQEVAASSSQPKSPTKVHDIQSLLNQLAVSGSGSQKKEGKAPEDYKFWNTQPVPKFKEPNLLQTTSNANGEDLPEGPILPDKTCSAFAKPEPGPLLNGFEWCQLDLDSEDGLEELYDLLDNHYVEDSDGSFRFKYSRQFLSWALKPPGWKKDWHIGVRTKSKDDGKQGKLVASIFGIPVTLKVGDKSFNSTEINFLAIHRKLRNKRLAPELIKEVTRRCYLTDVYQALYTAGKLLPTPITTCRYYHRSLDWEHLYKNGFSFLPPGSTELRQRMRYKVESQPQIKGLRAMKKEDVPAVKELLVRYLERFHLRQEWSEEEVEHWFCSAQSKDVVWAFVVETDGRITDFVSYYLLESTVLKSNNREESIRAAYLYYYASESAFQPRSGPKLKAKQIEENLGAQLQLLVHDALIMARKDNFHVFNAVSILDNPLFLKEQKFEPGDGKLHYYLFNWRTHQLGGGIDENNQLDAKKMGGIGVVML